MKTRIQAIQELLETSHDASYASLEALSERDLQVVVYPESGWTAADVVRHMADAGQGLLLQLDRLAGGEDPLPSDFDVDRWNAAAHKRLRALPHAEAMARIRTNHEKTLQQLAQIKPNQLDLTGTRPDLGLLSLEKLFIWTTEHMAHHTQDILAAVRAREP